MSLSVLLALSLSLTGSSGSYAAVSPTASREQTHQWVQCLVKKNPRLAQDVVLQRDGAWLKAFKDGFFFKPDCAPDGKSVRVSGITFFGPMAEFVLRTNDHPEAKRPMNMAVREVATQVAATLAEQETGSATQSAQIAFINHVGLCVNQRAPAAASLLLLSPIGTAEETKALQELADDIQQCRADEFNFELTTDEIRGAISVARLRVIHAASKEADNA